MAVGIIIGIIMVAAIIGLFVWMGISFEDGNTTKGVVALILAFIMFIGFFIVPFSFHTVQTGQVAVVKHLGRATHVRTAGTYFDLWVTDKYQKYDSKVQNTPVETVAYSNDAQSMTLQMNIQYQIRTDKVLDIANQYGKLGELNSRIIAIATEKAKSVLSKYTAMDIIANRTAMSPEVETVIMEAVGEEYFVDIIAVVLTDIEFSEAFEQAVEEKMIAEQNKLKASYENETKIAKAEADAQAKVLSAEAEAKANDLLEKSLTDKIIQEMYISKWDGKLPQVVSDGNMMFQIPEISGEEENKND